MIIIALLAVIAGLVGFNIAALYELRRIDTELQRARSETWRLKRQLDWLEWLLRKRPGK